MQKLEIHFPCCLRLIFPSVFPKVLCFILIRKIFKIFPKLIRFPLSIKSSNIFQGKFGIPFDMLREDRYSIIHFFFFSSSSCLNSIILTRSDKVCFYSNKLNLLTWMDKHVWLMKNSQTHWYCSQGAVLAFIWNEYEFWSLWEWLFTKKIGKDLVKIILNSLILKTLFFQTYAYLHTFCKTGNEGVIITNLRRDRQQGFNPEIKSNYIKQSLSGK